VHKPFAEDQYAPVFVSSAIAQLLCADMETLGQLPDYEPLVTFEREQQKLKPYGVVWVNSDPLDLSGGSSVSLCDRHAAPRGNAVRERESGQRAPGFIHPRAPRQRHEVFVSRGSVAGLFFGV
jgi:hypothetical protein